MKNYIKLCSCLLLLLGLSCASGWRHAQQDQGIMSQLLMGSSVFIEDEVINEEIALPQEKLNGQISTHIKGALVMQNCIVERDFLFENKQGGRIVWEGDVVLVNCVFEKGFRLNDGVFRGQVKIVNCTFFGDMDLQRSEFRGGLRVEDNQIGRDMIGQYSRTLGDLHAMSNEVGGNIRLQGLTVGGQSHFSNTVALGSLDMSKGHFHQSVFMNYMNVKGKALLTSSFFHEDLVVEYWKGNPSLQTRGSKIYGDFIESRKEN